MYRNLAVITLAVLFSLTCISKSQTAKPQKPRLLKDGFVLAGADGRLTTQTFEDKQSSESNLKWFFEFDSEVSDGMGVIEAGRKVQMLPSAGLEKMIAQLKEHPQGTFRLYRAIVTQYEGENFIFPNYFLAISEKTEPDSKTQPQDKDKFAVNEPNDEFTVPQEVIDKLASRSIIRTDHLRKQLKLEQDFVLAGRAGCLVEQPGGRLVFVFDTLGRNLEQFTLTPLPCRELERAQRQQSREPDAVRFEIAGIVTKYKGRDYLLLQKATRLYSHENFY